MTDIESGVSQWRCSHLAVISC